MIWYIYAILLFISLFLIVLGYSKNEISYQLLGFAFLFLLGVALINGIEYVSGNTIDLSFNETYVYGWNYSGYHWDYNDGPEILPQSEPPVNLFHRYRTETTTASNVYTTYSNFLIGFYLAILGALGFVLSFIEYRGGRGGDD